MMLENVHNMVLEYLSKHLYSVKCSRNFLCPLNLSLTEPAKTKLISAELKKDKRKNIFVRNSDVIWDLTCSSDFFCEG